MILNKKKWLVILQVIFACRFQGTRIVCVERPYYDVYAVLAVLWIALSFLKINNIYDSSTVFNIVKVVA